MKNCICFIIITYNNQKTIKKCLDSILEQDNFFKIKILIIDNNSRDKTIEILNEYIISFKLEKTIKIISNKNNSGFAKAVNQGINYTQREFKFNFYFLLNPDAYLKKDCLRKLINSLGAESPYLLSPLIINTKNNQPWFTGAKINWLKFKTMHKSLSLRLPTTNYQLLTSTYLTGCSLLIPQKIIQKIGLLDEKFFLYYEDADFSLRAKKAGFQLKIIPQAICYHQESQSSSSKIKSYYLVKSGLLFFYKHYPKFILPYFWSAFYLRFFYHKYISKKEPVLQAMSTFRKQIKKLQN